MFRPHLLLLPLAIILSCWQDAQAMAPCFTVKLWESPIPVKLDDALDDEEKEEIRSMFQLISDNTCIDFKENLPGPQLEYKWTGAGGTCRSSVGDVRGKDSNQMMNIPHNGCGHLHEMFHALGFYHTQQRFDRDQYLTVRKDNIKEGSYDWNFGKLDKTANTTDYGIPYEFGSFMHYSLQGSALAIDKSKPEMELKDPGYMNTIDDPKNTGVIIFNDWKAVNMHYKCNEKCSVKIACHNGGYQHPRNCTECVCPRYATGKNCETVADTSNLKVGETYSFYHGFPWKEEDYRGIMTRDNIFTTAPYPDYHNLQWSPPQIIKGPEGSRIRVTIKKLYDEEVAETSGCPAYDCNDKAVEIVDGDLTRVGKKFCCYKDAPLSFLSETNVVGISIYAISGLDFTANATLTVEMPN